MAKTASLNIRLEPATKTKAEVLFSNFGITLSDAVTMFLNQSIIDGGLPFQVKLGAPNATTLAAMREAEAKDAPGRFASPEELFEDLGIQPCSGPTTRLSSKRISSLPRGGASTLNG